MCGLHSQNIYHFVDSFAQMITSVSFSHPSCSTPSYNILNSFQVLLCAVNCKYKYMCV